MGGEAQATMGQGRAGMAVVGGDHFRGSGQWLFTKQFRNISAFNSQGGKSAHSQPWSWD